MSANIVEALSRHTARSVTRRGLLLTLGGTLAAAVAPALVLAEENKGQKRKKAKKKAEKKAAEQARQAQEAENQANQVCASQVAGCRTEILSVCGLDGGLCLAAAQCCESLAACNTTAFFTCVVDVSNNSN